MRLLKLMKLDSSYGSMVQRTVNYVLDDAKVFKFFLQDGCIEMHNNAIERMFRHLAMGRRNWLHTGSHQGAENIAFMFSLFESCKLNDINFGDYIEDVLTWLMSGDQDFMSLYKTSKKVDAKAANWQSWYGFENKYELFQKIIGVVTADNQWLLFNGDLQYDGMLYQGRA